jgi:hypothetical protein
MIESFWKKYWFDVLISIGLFIGAIVFLCFGYVVSTVAYVVAGLSWITLALVSYNRDRINALAKRVTDLEAMLYKEKNN